MRQNKAQIQLGLGLIGLGREWGSIETAVPSEKEALRFLERSYSLGITFYDTAPSYGLSEQRLGRFLKGLNKGERERIKVATKFGDHWDIKNSGSYVDHSYTALCRSLDTSMELLNGIDVLQIHKADIDILSREDTERALNYAWEIGIRTFGVSLKDTECGVRTVRSNRFEYIQLPYNEENPGLRNIINYANQQGIIVLVNRPFNMGKCLYEGGVDRGFNRRVALFRAVLRELCHGYILTGTKSVDHLIENIKAFKIALDDLNA